MDQECIGRCVRVGGPAGRQSGRLDWEEAVTEEKSARRQIHWAKTRNLTFVVLAIWFVFSTVLPWFAKELDAFSFLGFKLGYYFIVQGSLIVFVALIVVQNLLQDSIDDEYGSGDR